MLFRYSAVHERELLKRVVVSAVCALALASLLVTAALANGFPSISGALAMTLGFPGFGVATTLTVLLFSRGQIDSIGASVCFIFVYVVINSTTFTFIFFGAWETLAILRRSLKHPGSA
jgi:hypothetical protein